MKLVATYHPDILPDTHLHLAKVTCTSILIYNVLHTHTHTHMYRSWKVTSNTDKQSIILYKLMNGNRPLICTGLTTYGMMPTE